MGFLKKICTLFNQKAGDTANEFDLDETCAQFEDEVHRLIKQGLSSHDAVKQAYDKQPVMNLAKDAILNGAKIKTSALIIRPELPTSWSYTDEQDQPGIFRCKNRKCEAVHLKLSASVIPDVCNCPLCGTPMLNEEIVSRWVHSLSLLNNAHAGTPNGLNKAKYAWPFFYRYYHALFEAEEIESWNADVPSLEYILDILSKINISDKFEKICREMQSMKLDRYPEIEENCKYILELQKASTTFISECITEKPQKQVDLVKKFSSRIEPILESMGQEPEARKAIYVDAKWYFYVWRQFGLVKCTKVGRYNMIYK